MVINKHYSLYKSYIKEVSTKDMALSLEVQNSIIHHFSENKIRIALDFGSGISSVLFSLLKNFCNQETITIDDNMLWLIKTQQFFKKYHIPMNRSYLLNEFLLIKPFIADFILYDLGRMPTRYTYTDLIFKYANTGTTILIDDAHKSEYLKHVINISSNYGFSIVNQTPKDEFGRFGVFLSSNKK